MRAILCVLLFVGASFGRPLVVLAADPNACGPQMDYRAAMPLVDRLPPADPNDPNALDLHQGPVLGPVPGDPNVWDVPAGTFKRDWARCCDPEGDPIAVVCVGGTGPATVQIDAQAGTWTFSAVAVVGLNAWLFEADDGKAQRRVWIIAWGLHNEPPVLE